MQNDVSYFLLKYHWSNIEVALVGPMEEAQAYPDRVGWDSNPTAYHLFGLESS